MARKKVTFGTSGHVLPPVETVIKSGQRYESQGYDTIWWPDHIMGWHPQTIWVPEITEMAKTQANPHVYLDASLCMAVSAVTTTKIKIATGVTEPIRYHPALLAQKFLTLDHLSKGRAVLGIGAGEGENIIPYGMEYTHIADRMEEALQIIRLLWEHDEPVDFDGRFWKLRGAVIGYGPYEPGKYPPIIIASHGPKMLSITARYGDGWLPFCLPSQQWAEGLATILRIAAQHSRDMSHFMAGSWAYVVIDRSHEECHRLFNGPLVRFGALLAPPSLYKRLGYRHPLSDRFGEDFQPLAKLIPSWMSREDAMDAIAKVPEEVMHEFFVHGTADEVAEQVDAYAQAGLQHFMAWNFTFLDDLSKVRSSFELLAEVVKMFQEE
ncbi:MAG: LLM class flavin-dependent oxidoreductase [Chloroflexi bacterium]|nr:LLM class flavin-dependent oxidoreductase [Chloroflexota bacterium]